jgi:hypothetical protein
LIGSSDKIEKAFFIFKGMEKENKKNKLKNVSGKKPL